MDAADAIAAWGSQLHMPGSDKLERWGELPESAPPPAAPLRAGDRLRVFWADMNEWFSGTYRASRVEPADGGGKQRSSCILYDATGPWARCNAKELTYWHCLDDEQWQPE